MTTVVEPSSSPSSERFESVGPRESKSRLAAWDAARLLATAGIVWTHVAEAHGQPEGLGALGRFGTSYYILAAAMFTVRSAIYSSQRHFFEEVVKKGKRLMLPFFTWSAIYFLYYGYGAVGSGQSWESLTRWWGPFAGTAIHLWFLPFIYVWGLVGTFLVPQLMKLPRWLHYGAGSLVSFGVYWFCYTWLWFAVSRYWLWDYHLHRLDRWIVEVPLYIAAIVFGSAFYRLTPLTHIRLKRQRKTIFAISCAIFLASEWIFSSHLAYLEESTNSEARFMANIAGLALLCGSATISHTKLINKLAPWGRYTYVAFLCHMLVLELVRDPMKHLPGYGTLSVAIACNVGIFVASILTSMLIMHFRFLRWLRP